MFFWIILLSIIFLAALTDGIVYWKTVRRREGAIRLVWLGQLLFFAGVCLSLYAYSYDAPLKWDDYIPSKLLWLFVLIAFPKILFLSYYLLIYCPFKYLLNPKLLYRSGFLLGGLLFSALFYAGIWGVDQLEVEQHTLTYDQLPEAFDGYQVVHISDLHVGGLLHYPALLSQMVTEINSLQPDVILFTGDMVNKVGSELTPFLPVLAELQAKQGIYWCLGNHDYGNYHRWPSPQAKAENIRYLIESLDDIGWKLLNNTSVALHQGMDTIRIAGIGNWGDHFEHDAVDFDQALPVAQSDRFTILLSHNPVMWPQQLTCYPQVALTLSGHTHAMQFEWFGFTPAQWVYSHSSGLYHEDNKYLYVNKGLGHTAIPMRVGAYPEITHITLRKKDI